MTPEQITQLEALGIDVKTTPRDALLLKILELIAKKKPPRNGPPSQYTAGLPQSHAPRRGRVDEQ